MLIDQLFFRASNKEITLDVCIQFSFSSSEHSDMTSLISRVRKSSGSVASSARNYLSEQKTTLVHERESRAFGNRFEKQREVKSRCCEGDSDVRTASLLGCNKLRRHAPGSSVRFQLVLGRTSSGDIRATGTADARVSWKAQVLERVARWGPAWQ